MDIEALAHRSPSLPSAVDVGRRNQTPAGFPKFTGGWLYAVPATGDADGDGRLDIAAVTREGRAFLWRTDRPACGGNGEWWTSRHDERSTGAYGTDTRPPGTAGGATAVPGRKGEEFTIAYADEAGNRGLPVTFPGAR